MALDREREARESFHYFDRDNDGKLAGDELKHLVAFNFNVKIESISDWQVADVLALVQDDSTPEQLRGAITPDQFVKLFVFGPNSHRMTDDTFRQMLDAIKKYASANFGASKE